MKQTDLGLNLATKRTRKRKFLDEMNLVVPWAELMALLFPFAPEGRQGRPPFALVTMLRIHFMQQWFGQVTRRWNLALHDVPLCREFTGLDNWLDNGCPTQRFRHRSHEARGTMHDAPSTWYLVLGLVVDERQRVLRDRQFLVCRDDPDRHAAVRVEMRGPPEAVACTSSFTPSRDGEGRIALQPSTPPARAGRQRT